MHWLPKPIPASEQITGLASALGVDGLVASLLLQRGVTTFDEAKAFFRPNLGSLHDPFLMKGMYDAVERISMAFSVDQPIMVYGDYDVDGTTAVALVYQFLKGFNPNIEYYIPDRNAEGYGISFQGIDVAEQHGVKLIIALDCGIRSVDKVAYAKAKGIDFIICDHHLPAEVVPDAVAVLDPKQADCNYPFKELSGCGIGFKLCQALCQRFLFPLSDAYQYLDLVATSIGADIVPIVGENRTLAYFGMEKINTSPGVGIKTIFETNNIKRKVTISDVVFIVAPRINAAGRIAHGSNAVKLLIAPDQLLADEFNQIVHYNNIERRSLDTNITIEALGMVENNAGMSQAKSTVVFANHWNKGVVGIVASRLIEKYYRPTIVLTESNGKATGSARSVKDFDIHAAISACADLLEQFGGHKYAAGLTLPLENVDAFAARFEEVVSSSITPDMLIEKLETDLEIGLEQITPKFVRILKQFGPFGPENMQPVFVSRGVYVRSHPRVLGDAHLKLEIVSSPNDSDFIPAIFFKSIQHLPSLVPNIPFDMAYCIEENEFKGNATLQLVVKDIALSASQDFSALV